MNDPTVNAATGKPCKGKLAARALAVFVLDPRLSVLLRNADPMAFEQAEKALVPFGWPDRAVLADKLGDAPTPAVVMRESYVRVDYDTRAELGPASHELRALYEAAQKRGEAYVKVFISCVQHRVIVIAKHAPKAAVPKAAVRVLVPDAAKFAVQARVNALAAPESESELGSESALDACWPHCHCLTPSLWAKRKVDGPWTMGPGEPALEQRTCKACGFASSREVGR